MSLIMDFSSEQIFFLLQDLLTLLRLSKIQLLYSRSLSIFYDKSLLADLITVKQP